MLGAEIHPIAVNWPDRKQGPWTVTFHMTLIGDRAECVGVDLRSFREDRLADAAPVKSRPGPGGLTPVAATTWRALPVKSLEREARRFHAEVLRAAAGIAGNKQSLRQAAEALEEPARGWHSREHFERVAAIYREAWASGDPHPTKAVHEQLKAPSRSAAAKWVARARNEFGLLEKTEPGRPGGARAQKTTKKGR